MPKFQKIVTVVGGTGFLGRYVVKELAKAGYTVRVISRHPETAGHLKTAGNVGQVVLQRGDITKPETFAGKLDGSFAVIDLVGILFERGRQTFTSVQAKGAEKLAQEAWKCGAEHFVYLSAIGVNKSQNAKYSRSKAMGEKAVQAAFKDRATIIRPSVLFGAEDNFFNKFASLLRFTPVMPLIGGGKNRFQPVFVGDVARAIVATLGKQECRGEVYEVGGPRVMSFREILTYIMEVVNRPRPFFSAPHSFWKMKAWFWEFMPKPILTRDQVQLLKYDNVVDRDVKTLADLGISPTSIEVIVPSYLARFRAKGESEVISEA